MSTSLNKKIASRIKQLRIDKGITQEEMSFDLNASHSYMSRIEMGQHSPSIETIQKICDVLEISLAEFFKDL